MNSHHIHIIQSEIIIDSLFSTIFYQLDLFATQLLPILLFVIK